jgi:LPXTG-motif cell wall-anchored protein
MLTSGHANANLTSNDRTSVTSKSGTLSVGGGTYSTWYEGEMASDRVFVAEATSNASYLTLKNKARDSWLAATVSSSWFSKTYNLRGYTTKSSASAFFLSNGVLQSSEGNNWSGNTRYNVVYSDNKFTASTGTSNAVKLYEKVSLPGSLVFTIVNTPVASTKYEIHLEKVSEKDGRGLKGAKFQVLDSNGNALRFTTSGNGVYTLSTANTAVSELVTSTGGRMILTGLTAGNYTLRETEAPVGHLLMEDYQLTLGEGSQGTSISLRLVDPIFAYSLPETGGSGTTMYIVVGLVLLLTGSALLFQKRRREAVENS